MVDLEETMKAMRQKLEKELERGKEYANHIRNIIDHDDGSFKLGNLDAYSFVVSTAFDNALSMLPEFIAFFDNNTQQPFTIQESAHLEFSNTTNDTKGGSKKRMREEPKEIESSNTDDSYAWRKYGQKSIQHSPHPRSYYRCTHKNDQGCQAIKQVQQISDNPIKFNIIYRGHHSCNKTSIINYNYNTPNLLDLIDDQHDDYDNPSNFLNFEKPTLHNPNFMIFPSSSPPPNSSSTTTSNAVVEQVYNPPLEDIGSQPLDYSNIQCPSSSSSGLASNDVNSWAEIYSSVATTHEDHSYLLSDSIDFDHVFQDYIDSNLHKL